jgi:hypothetical protein
VWGFVLFSEQPDVFTIGGMILITVADAVGEAQESGVTEADDDAEEADKPKE